MTAAGHGQDIVRPGLHFTASAGWVNDPHGITFHGGRYHAFFQHVPGAVTWRSAISWGHATSPDLLTWTEHPVALHPGDGDDGCFSGTLALPDSGPAALLYTSVTARNIDLGRVRLARPADADWSAWVKGPVVASAPDDLPLAVYRDPFVFREGRRWRMLVGVGFGDARRGSSATPRATSSAGCSTGRSTCGRRRASSTPGPGWPGSVRSLSRSTDGTS